MSNNNILSIFKSRKTIIELLEYLEYNVKQYESFNLNTIDAMFSNNQLDMIVKNDKNNTTIYIKYYLGKSLRTNIIDDILEDLYIIDNVLTDDDTLIIIIDDEPNTTLINYMIKKYETDNKFIVIHNIQRLQFNILKHAYVPKHKILNNNEVELLKEKYNLISIDKLPEISRFDPVSLAICLRPKQICEIERDSIVSLKHKFYRVCV